MSIVENVWTTGGSSAAVDALRRTVSGRVTTPAEPDYPGLAMPWNVAVASTPAVVVEVVDATDVVSAVRFATENQLGVVVQATGHGAWSHAEPTLLVQTGRLDEVTIDPGGSARAGAGARWAAVLEAAAAFGLAGVAGSAPGVGVVGYTTGGGLGPVARSFGYASDQVTAFDVVTGDGELRRATPTENPALFWGLRGGKGALGIVTAVEFDLMRQREIVGGALYFDGADAPTVLHAWRDWAEQLPEEATTSVAVLRLPDAPMVPPPLAGRITVAVRFGWTGEPEAGKRHAAQLAGVAPVLLGDVDVMPYSALGTIHADPVDPMPTSERGSLLRELPARAVDALIDAAGPTAPCPLVVVELRQMGGALQRPGLHPSAVCHRDAAFSLLTIGIDVPPLAAATAAGIDAVHAALQPWAAPGTQPNFGATSDPARIARNYDPATLTRLGTLSATYDPHGVLAAGRVLREACLVAG